MKKEINSFLELFTNSEYINLIVAAGKSMRSYIYKNGQWFSFVYLTNWLKQSPRMQKFQV